MMLLMKNCTNFIIGIIVCRCGIDLGPVKLSLVHDTGFIVSDSFVTLFLRMIQDLAVPTEFTIT